MVQLSAVSRLAFNHPKLVIGVLLAITLVFALFLPRIQFDADLEKMVPEDDPIIKDIRDATAEFGYQDVFLWFFAVKMSSLPLSRRSDLAENRRIPGVKASWINNRRPDSKQRVGDRDRACCAFRRPMMQSTSSAGQLTASTGRSVSEDGVQLPSWSMEAAHGLAGARSSRIAARSRNGNARA